MQTIIDSLGVADVAGQTNYVVRVTWRVCAETQRTYDDGTPIIIAESRRSVLPVESTTSGFVPFDNLTQEIVINWISQTLEYADAIAVLSSRLAEENAPATRLKPLPWVQE